MNPWTWTFISPLWCKILYAKSLHCTDLENWKNIGWRSQTWLPNEVYVFTRRYFPVPPTSGKMRMKQTHFQLVVQLRVFKHWHVISEIANNLNMDSETKLYWVSMFTIFPYFSHCWKLGKLDKCSLVSNSVSLLLFTPFLLSLSSLLGITIYCWS